jgi:hypothetical protein
VLGGCAVEVVPPQAWTFDPTHPQAKPAMPADEAASLSQRIAQLQMERMALLTRVAQENDAWQRQALYAQLHSLGLQLSPLERRVNAYAAAR